MLKCLLTDKIQRLDQTELKYGVAQGSPLRALCCFLYHDDIDLS